MCATASKAIKIKCACGKSYRVSRAHGGRSVGCPSCGHVMLIPKDAPDDESPSMSDATTLPPLKVASPRKSKPAPSPGAAEQGQRKVGATEAIASAQADTIGPGRMVKPRIVGNYELLSEIARGGMGVVFKARQTNLDRIVAVKMILAGEFAGEDDVKRFYTEAQAAASLHHPGIVSIFEVGQHQGQHYYSMGYIEGQSLAAKVAAGPLPPRQAAELTLTIAEAVQYAHEKGIIHRDLNPNNILLDQADAPHITDFGLAKRGAMARGLTSTGQIMGTPSYMAPEQAAGKGHQAGPAADVYALGAVLYRMLTGRPPFQAAGYLETLIQVLEAQPISPRALNPGVPQDLAAICLACLEKDPARRLSSARALIERVRRFLSSDALLRREHEARMAQEIQDGMRPKCSPALERFDIAGGCHPSATTGGDYFDYVPMRNGRLGVVVASMSSPGLGPALIMAGTRRVLRTMASFHDDLAEILSEANRAIAEDAGSDYFVTMFLARLDPAARSLTYAGAGHEGHLLSLDGDTRTLGSTSLALGIDEHCNVQCGELVKLEPGELLVLLTDGFQAARAPDGRHFGTARALEIVHRHRSAPAGQIVETLFQAVHEFCLPDVPQDDVTAVVVKVV